LCAVNTSTAGARYLYVNDAADLDAATATHVNEEIGFASMPVMCVGAAAGGLVQWNGCYAEFWFTNQYIDISVEANRRLFISASSKPVYLGVKGDKPLSGTEPLVYLPNKFNNIGINKGSGGDFPDVTGSLEDCGDSPSD
jgi:hypothetical protein